MSLLRVRLFRKNDIAFADSLRALAGWNQRPQDWLRFLDHQPGGCFIAEWGGHPVGTATTTIYEDKVAWIGMVLVHPEARRRGIGRALLEHCIAFLQPRVTCIKLDATPLGRTLYEKLGFKDEWTLQRWESRRAKIPAKPRGGRVRQWKSEDTRAMQALDQAAFGVNRWRMVRRMARQPARSLVGQSPMRGIDAFGILREGARAHYLGPVVGESIAAAEPLLRTFVGTLPWQQMFWDIPDANTDAVELARCLGFASQRPLIRMALGENKWPGKPQHIYALAGPEIG